MRPDTRSLNLETLERRQLMAADIGPASETCFAAPPTTAAPDQPLHPTGASGFGENLSTTADGSADAIRSFVSAPHTRAPLSLSDGEMGLVQQHGERLFAVDTNAFTDESTLVVYAADNSIITEVAVDFRVERMVVDGDQVLLLSTSDHVIPPMADLAVIQADQAAGIDPIPPIHFPWGAPQIIAVTVVLSNTEPEIVRQTIDGPLGSVAYDAGNLSIAVDPNAVVYLPHGGPTLSIPSVLTSYRWTDDGLSQLGTVDALAPLVPTARGNDVFTATTHSNYPGIYLPWIENSGQDGSAFSPESLVTRYRLDANQVERMDQISLGDGQLVSFQIADDGLTGVAVQRIDDAQGMSTYVHLLDLSNDRIAVFDTTPCWASRRTSGRPIPISSFCKTPTWVTCL
ncbi:hypothetical protein K227x_43930 [Rubripirellula lacrimiformis]|uniref:Uncharacterized protein n=1 Tax=Rubripirellula lacrimiformis TaxID=1930273 RepID=A0A517NFS0_9BACT|nr:hypothetical protein [Rubripirellula lacrimiformis]QDT05986.1 hypothetical protein K227x_43930 [Rubripirellula lacrimiformis]